MGTARLFDEILKSQLHINAAWLPITNTFKLGDYGVMSDGVFVAIGNIESDFGVTLEKALGPNSDLNFTSEGTNISRVVGNAQVNAFPESDVDAKLIIEFSNESSFLLKANLTLLQMQNVNQAAYAIYHNPQWEHWRYKYRVVSSTFTGKDCALISSNSRNSSIELSGKANALKQFDLGAVAVGIGATNRKEIGLDLVGAAGVVGLSFFKLTWLGGPDPKNLAPGELPPGIFADAKTLEADDI